MKNIRMDIDVFKEIKIMNKYIKMARYAATLSPDPSTKCGAVILRQDYSFCSLGYNKFPEGVRSSADLWNNREEKMYRVVHAEESAILNAKENLHGYRMFVTPMYCCSHCAAIIIESGIKEVIFDNPEGSELYIERWKKSQSSGLEMFKEAFVEVSYTHEE